MPEARPDRPKIDDVSHVRPKGLSHLICRSGRFDSFSPSSSHALFSRSAAVEALFSLASSSLRFSASSPSYYTVVICTNRPVARLFTFVSPATPLALETSQTQNN